jgi:hypothetical protein
MFIIPAILNIANIRKSARNGGQELSSGANLEVAANYGMMATGLAMAVIGVSVTVLREMGKM